MKNIKKPYSFIERGSAICLPTEAEMQIMLSTYI